MIMKANFSVILKANQSISVELWDVDPLIDDKLAEMVVYQNGDYSFLFESNMTGELVPELILKFKDDFGHLVYQCNSQNTVTGWGTFRSDNSCVEFGEVLL